MMRRRRLHAQFWMIALAGATATLALAGSAVLENVPLLTVHRLAPSPSSSVSPNRTPPPSAPPPREQEIPLGELDGVGEAIASTEGEVPMQSPLDNPSAQPLTGLLSPGMGDRQRRELQEAARTALADRKVQLPTAAVPPGLTLVEEPTPPTPTPPQAVGQSPAQDPAETPGKVNEENPAPTVADARQKGAVRPVDEPTDPSREIASNEQDAPAGDPGRPQDRQIDAFALESAAAFRDGELVAQSGVNFKSRYPRAHLAAILDSVYARRPLTVEMRITLGEDGVPLLVEVIDSSGVPSIDRVIMLSMYDWWFETTLPDGRSLVNRPFPFTYTLR